MKDYKEMAADVLARRDKELSKRHRQQLFKAITIPAGTVAAAAVITVAAVEIVPRIASTDGERGETFTHHAVDVNTSDNELGEPYTPIKPYEGEPDRIEFKTAEKFSFGEDMAFDEKFFQPKTVDELNAFYGVDILTLSEKYADWEFSAMPYGFYIDEGSDGEIAWHNMLSLRNSVSYILGEKLVTVSFQMSEFPDPTGGIENGIVERNYDSAAVDNAATTEARSPMISEPSGGSSPSYSGTGELRTREDISVINGLGVKLWETEGGSFYADIEHYDVGCHIGIYAYGLTREEFLDDVRRFTV